MFMPELVKSWQDYFSNLQEVATRRGFRVESRGGYAWGNMIGMGGYVKEFALLERGRNHRGVLHKLAEKSGVKSPFSYDAVATETFIECFSPDSDRAVLAIAEDMERKGYTIRYKPTSSKLLDPKPNVI